MQLATTLRGGLGDVGGNQYRREGRHFPSCLDGAQGLESVNGLDFCRESNGMAGHEHVKESIRPAPASRLG